MTNTNPLQGFVSVCCGAEHDINAEHHILNESVRGGCSACGHYSEFDIFENFVENRLDIEPETRRQQAIGLASLNSFVPDMSDYHMDLW